MPTVDFTVIIPHKDSILSIGRLLSSIPISDNIEVLIIDNSTQLITRNTIGLNRY